jgi:hypothetical protein
MYPMEWLISCNIDMTSLHSNWFMQVLWDEGFGFMAWLISIVRTHTQLHVDQHTSTTPRTISSNTGTSPCCPHNRKHKRQYNLMGSTKASTFVDTTKSWRPTIQKVSTC